MLGRFTGLLLLAAGAFAALSCESVAGIKDYRLCDEQCQRCETFCGEVGSSCTGSNQVYLNATQCNGMCSSMDLGNFDEFTQDNTVACRTQKAEAAGNEVEDAEKVPDCQAASPTGGNDDTGVNNCYAPGTDGACETYCKTYPHVCPSIPLLDDCVNACAGLHHAGSFNLTDNYTGDTLECRLVHLSAATQDPKTHCPHARFAADYESAGFPCTNLDDGSNPPNCADYCQLVTAVCSDTLAVYESNAQCLAVCQAQNNELAIATQFPPGKNADDSGNSIACRKYHTYNAATPVAGIDSRPVHCPHAGPGGGPAGVCHDDDTLAECEPFCSLAQSVCPDEFKSAYGAKADDSFAACQSACLKLPDRTTGPTYSVMAAAAELSSQNPEDVGLWGRFLLASRLAEDPTSANCGDLLP
jgi:hypothetical protein